MLNQLNLPETNSLKSADPDEFDKPTVFESDSIADFIKARLNWLYRSNPNFSIRKRLKDIPKCSPSLVTQVVSGQRRLTHDKLDSFAALVGLDHQEKLYLETWIDESNHTRNNRNNRDSLKAKRHAAKSLNVRTPKNHLLNDWLNVYIKDLVRLKAFRPDPYLIQKLLGGIVNINRIKRSISFLLKEGFLLRKLDGSLVENEFVTLTTSDIPHKKIKAFHKKSLDLAKNAIDAFDVAERRAACVVMPLDKNSFMRLNEIIKSFHHKLTMFAEEHGTAKGDTLYQVILNLSPISYDLKK